MSNGSFLEELGSVVERILMALGLVAFGVGLATGGYLGLQWSLVLGTTALAAGGGYFVLSIRPDLMRLANRARSDRRGDVPGEDGGDGR